MVNIIEYLAVFAHAHLRIADQKIKKKSTQSLLTYIRRQNPYAIYVPTGTPNMNPKPRHLLLDFQIISGIADTRHGI